MICSLLSVELLNIVTSFFLESSTANEVLDYRPLQHHD